MMLVERRWGYTITSIKVRSALGRGIPLVTRLGQRRIPSRSCHPPTSPTRRPQASRQNSSILRSRCRPPPRRISPKRTTIRLHSINSRSSNFDQTCIVKTLTTHTGRLTVTCIPDQSFLPSYLRLIPSHISSGSPATSSYRTYNSSFSTCSRSCLSSTDKSSSMRRFTRTLAP